MKARQLRHARWIASAAEDGLRPVFEHQRIVRPILAMRGMGQPMQLDEPVLLSQDLRDRMRDAGVPTQVQLKGGRTVCYLVRTVASSPESTRDVQEIVGEGHFNFSRTRSYDKRVGRLASFGRALKAYYGDIR